MESMPFISALIVTRNEKDYIEAAVLSLIHQSYPKDRYEIIIIDGMSDDGSRDIIISLIQKYSEDNYHINIIDNPQKILASGWNIGIRNAKGSYVTRIDAHATASSSFIEKSVETILRVKDAVCVGGKLVTEHIDGDDEVVSNILSSPFGVGNSSFRVSNIEGYADTAVYGLYKTDIFTKVGFFNENCVRNQDIELHSRIKKAGGKFYFNPEIVCTYYSRNSVKKMLKQAYGNGMWNMILLKNQRSALSLRHLVPFAFDVFLIINFFLGIKKKVFWIIDILVILLHLSIGLVFAIKRTKKLLNILRMPVGFLALHITYGAGYFAGIVKKVNLKEENNVHGSV